MSSEESSPPAPRPDVPAPPRGAPALPSDRPAPAPDPPAPDPHAPAPASLARPRRLHPAGIVVYAVDALRDVAFPLAVAAAAVLLGGGVDAEDLLRTAGFAALAALYAVVSGVVGWRTTTYRLGAEGISLRRGLLSVKETDVPLARIQGLDVVQGPVQRLLGVQGVQVQTAGGGAKGELVLGAVGAAELAELRAFAATGGARRIAATADRAAAFGPSTPPASALGDSPAPAGGASLAADEPAPLVRRLSRSRLLLAAVTAGQLGIVLPILAGAGRALDEVFDEPGRGSLGLLPDTLLEVAVALLALLALAWLLSTLGAVIAFAGFEVTRDEQRLRLRRGLLAQRETTVRVERVQAVRVVEGLLRRPFGLAALRVEVAGYAAEAGAAQTLFPLLRRAEVRPFLDALLPELADDPEAALAPAPPRAARRYVLPGALAGLLVGAVVCALVPSLAPWPLLLALPLALDGWLDYRAAGWRLTEGRLVVRSRGLAWTTVLAPVARLQAHALVQSPLQRRTGLADLTLALGKGTRARVRHLDLPVAREVWERLRA